jgi:hypothetical protein
MFAQPNNDYIWLALVILAGCLLVVLFVDLPAILGRDDAIDGHGEEPAKQVRRGKWAE